MHVMPAIELDPFFLSLHYLLAAKICEHSIHSGKVEHLAGAVVRFSLAASLNTIANISPSLLPSDESQAMTKRGTRKESEKKREKVKVSVDDGHNWKFHWRRQYEN